MSAKLPHTHDQPAAPYMGRVGQKYFLKLLFIFRNLSTAIKCLNLKYVAKYIVNHLGKLHEICLSGAGLILVQPDAQNCDDYFYCNTTKIHSTVKFHTSYPISRDFV